MKTQTRDPKTWLQTTLIRTWSIRLAVLAVLVGFSSWGLATWLSKDSKTIQRIMPDPNAAMFGDELGTPIGAPLEYIITDPKAFLGEENGVYLVNEKYLRQNNIYPLQTKTVWFIQRSVALAALVGLVLMLLLWTVVGQLNQADAKLQHKLPRDR